MTLQLPQHAHPEFLKKQAKQLLKAFRQQDVDFLAQFQTALNSTGDIKNLRDAQWVLARAYGYSGWQELTEAVELQNLTALPAAELVNEFIALACVSYTDADSVRRYQRARRLLAQTPGLAEQNFIAAVICHNVPKVQQALHNDPELARKTFAPLGWPPILYLTYSRVRDANQGQAVAIAKLLLESGADPNAHFIAEPHYHFTALTGALGEGEGGPDNQPPHPEAEALAELLLQAGANPNDSQGLYNTMFTTSGDQWLKLFVRYGLSKHERVNWDQTANAGRMFDFLLEFAINRNRVERVKYLLTLGADPNAQCHYADHSIYTQAMIQGDPTVLQLLEQAGARAETLSIATQFKLALNKHAYPDIKLLLEQQPDLLTDPDLLANAELDDLQFLVGVGLDVNASNAQGKTALHLFAGQGKLDCVKFLLDQGADPDQRDHYYQGRAVGHAHFNKQFAVRDYLLARYVYPLETAACGLVDRLREILEQDRTQVNARSPQGNTPLHVVCNWIADTADYAIRESVIDLLIQNGADIQAKNSAGQTPIDLYNSEADDENVMILSKYIA